jgi:hypothetical protein
MQCLDGQPRSALRLGEDQPLASDALDVLHPAVDQTNIMACVGELGADVTSDRSCTEDGNAGLRHGVSDSMSRKRFSEVRRARSGTASVL